VDGIRPSTGVRFAARFPNAPDQAQIWAQALKQWFRRSWRVIAQARAVGLPTSYLSAPTAPDDLLARARPSDGRHHRKRGNYQQRFCGGMRWSRRGVERMVIVRLWSWKPLLTPLGGNNFCPISECTRFH
jgi:hypothetical protein